MVAYRKTLAHQKQSLVCHSQKTLPMPHIDTRPLLAGFLAISMLASSTTLAADNDTDTARALISSFVEAVIAGPDKVAPLLAPEYQIMRSNGVGYDRAGYIGRGAGSVRAQRNYAYAMSSSPQPTTSWWSAIFSELRKPSTARPLPAAPPA
jgi:hypothetical protein